MVDEKTDEELAIMARTHTYVFGVLMERYEDRLMRYIMRISYSSKENSEDILQDSFLKAYQNINSFDSRMSFSSWMYRIVHNTAISSWRKSSARPEGHAVSVDDDFFARIVSDDDMMRDIDQQFMKSHIHVILQEMDEKYRDILILVFLEDKSYKEISEILKKPMGTVATLVNRAKKQFRTLYEAHYNKES